ncbi:MAG: response regulator transcription factor [Bacteroidota bacterium]
MIRLFVIEDHLTIILSGLKRLFYPARDGIEITGTSESVEDAISSADIRTFDLFILDLWLENRLPIHNFRQLKEHFPDKPVLIYTSEGSFSWKQRMLKEGAMAYLTKKATRAELKSAIEKSAKGEGYFPVDLEQITNETKDEGLNNEQNKLPPMQLEILQMMSIGLKQNDIGKALNISTSSIEKTLKALRVRFNVKNNLALFSLLNERGEN